MSVHLTGLLLTFILINAMQRSSSSLPPATLDGCPGRCGNVSVPYPFGTLEGCAKTALILTCNNAFDPPRLFLDILFPKTPVEVTDISLDTITILYGQIARECASPLYLPDPTKDRNFTTFNLGDLPYTISSTHNKLTVIGCDSMGFFSAGTKETTISCLSFCEDGTAVTNGTCLGQQGCCQAPLSKGFKELSTLVGSFNQHRKSRSINNCTAAFPVQQEWFNFSYADLLSFSRKEVPVILEWVVHNESCAIANRSAQFACVGGTGRTTCVDSTSGQGYRCHCADGYEGNPYIPDGCQDINECKDPNNNLCSDVCTNTPGNYTCSCPKGTYGDGRKDGNGCIKINPKFPLPAQIALVVGFAFIVLFVSGSFLYLIRRKRKYILLKEKYFRNNGGLLLEQQMPQDGGGGNMVRIYSEDELKVATSNFSESTVLGCGGNGTVYRGVLSDKRVVAIKKSKVGDEAQMNQFINEIVLLTKVIHRNVVNLLGCCLKTQVPLLVYEYIPKGTLSHHIHPIGDQTSKLSWEVRLDIAADTAGAIAYLHSDLSIPIIHRDIKSANILLDDQFTAKVADFGASRLAPEDEAAIATMVQGTLGYLDPEYVHSGQLTDKSDVYSFGVVLAELLTGEKPISFSRASDMRNLAIYFLVNMDEGTLEDILDQKVREESSREQVMAFAQIAKRCLGVKGEERPTMKEVAADLEKLRGYGGKPLRAGSDADESEYMNSLVHENASSHIENDDGTSFRETDWSITLQR